MAIDSALQRARQGLFELLAEIPQGGKLPGERLLSEEIGVCRMTLRRAIEDLILDGRLERHPRSGTYVRRPIISSEMRLKSFTEELKKRGMVPTTHVLSLKQIRANKDVAKNLRIPERELIYVATRLRFGDGTPISIETLKISPRLIPEISVRDLEESLYEYFANTFKVKITHAKASVVAHNPTSHEMDLLKVSSKTPCLLMKMIDYDQNGRPVMLAECLYRSDLYELDLEMSAHIATSREVDFAEQRRKA